MFLIALRMTFPPEALTCLILLASPFFFRILRQRGLIAMERLMGMLLVMIAVQMLMNGLSVVMKF